MSIISLIAAVDAQGGLGKDGQLLCHLPADLQHFKRLTLGKPIIMGRKTFESIGKPLPGRTNIMITHQPIQKEGVIVVHSVTEALRQSKHCAEVMIIGGASIYEQTLAIADQVFLTQIEANLSADVFFPKLESAAWVCHEKIFKPRDERNVYDMTFCHFLKKYKSI